MRCRSAISTRRDSFALESSAVRSRTRSSSVSLTPPRLFGMLALGDVARHLGGADDMSVDVPDRRHGQRNGDLAAVLGLPHGLEVVDFLAPAKPSEHVLFFPPAVRWNDQGN